MNYIFVCLFSYGFFRCSLVNFSVASHEHLPLKSIKSLFVFKFFLAKVEIKQPEIWPYAHILPRTRARPAGHGILISSHPCSPRLHLHLFRRRRPPRFCLAHSPAPLHPAPRAPSSHGPSSLLPRHNHLRLPLPRGRLPPVPPRARRPRPPPHHPALSPLHFPVQFHPPRPLRSPRRAPLLLPHACSRPSRERLHPGHPPQTPLLTRARAPAPRKRCGGGSPPRRPPRHLADEVLC